MTAPYLGLWLEEGRLPRGRSCDHPRLSSRTGRKFPPAAVSPTKMKMQERRPKMVGELLKLVSNNAVQVCGWSGDPRGFIHQGKPCKEHGDAFCAKISGQTQSKGIGRPAQRRLQRVAAESPVQYRTGNRAASVQASSSQTLTSITGAPDRRARSRTQGPESAFSS